MSSGERTPREQTPGRIVLLEDDRATAALILRVLAGASIANPLEHFTSGLEAAARLERASDPPDIPVLVILDLSVPDLSGLDVLELVRARPQLAGVPVIMLSGSEHDDEIARAYELGIDAYLVKPAGVHGLPGVIRRLGLPQLLMRRPP